MYNEIAQRKQSKEMSNYLGGFVKKISMKPEKYEKRTSKNQDLTFKYVKCKFEEMGMFFDIKGSSLVNNEGEYNNAALLLSDQNPTVSEVVIFQGTETPVFWDKKEFKGSIMKQLEEIIYFSNLFNKKRIVKTGKPQREEHQDIPPSVLREAICNCFCHRDYSVSGTLYERLSLEEIKEGTVSRRNQIIADVLDKTKFVENYGKGVRRIFSDYEGYCKKPEYEVSEDAVVLTVYNRNYNASN